MKFEHIILQEIGCFGRYRLSCFGDDYVPEVLRMSELGLISMSSDISEGETESGIGQWCELTTRGWMRLHEINERRIGDHMEHLFSNQFGESEEALPPLGE